MLWKRTLIVSFIIFCLSTLIIAFYFNVDNRWEVPGWGKIVTNLMLLYLLFIFLRTFIIVLLSFLEYLFVKKEANLTHYPLVTILIPSFNEQVVIENAVLSIKKINYPNIEILIIDDGSFDMTSEIAKGFESKGELRVIYKENGGKADALNRGIDEALGEYILCVDADSVLNEDILLQSMGYFQSNPTLSAVAGRVEIGNSHNLLLKFQQLEYITGLNLFKRAQSFVNTVTIIPGPVGVFKREALIEINKYHTDTFAEDADLTIRLIMQGHKIKYNHNMIAVTEGPESIQQLLTQRYRWSRGMVQAIIKNINYLNPFKSNLRKFLTIFYMITESIFIPVVNFIFAILTVQFALTYGGEQILGAYFIGLTLLDISLTLFSMITEKNMKPFFVLAVVNRVTYGLFLETIRFFSIIDELFGIPMSWGQLERKGLKQGSSA